MDARIDEWKDGKMDAKRMDEGQGLHFSGGLLLFYMLLVVLRRHLAKSG